MPAPLSTRTFRDKATKKTATQDELLKGGFNQKELDDMVAAGELEDLTPAPKKKESSVVSSGSSPLSTSTEQQTTVTPTSASDGKPGILAPMTGMWDSVTSFLKNTFKPDTPDNPGTPTQSRPELADTPAGNPAPTNTPKRSLPPTPVYAPEEIKAKMERLVNGAPVTDNISAPLDKLKKDAVQQNDYRTRIEPRLNKITENAMHAMASDEKTYFKNSRPALEFGERRAPDSKYMSLNEGAMDKMLEGLNDTDGKPLSDNERQEVRNRLMNHYESAKGTFDVVEAARKNYKIGEDKSAAKINKTELEKQIMGGITKSDSPNPLAGVNTDQVQQPYELGSLSKPQVNAESKDEIVNVPGETAKVLRDTRGNVSDPLTIESQNRVVAAPQVLKNVAKEFDELGASLQQKVNKGELSVEEANEQIKKEHVRLQGSVGDMIQEKVNMLNKQMGIPAVYEAKMDILRKRMEGGKEGDIKYDMAKGELDELQKLYDSGEYKPELDENWNKAMAKGYKDVMIKNNEWTKARFNSQDIHGQAMDRRAPLRDVRNTLSKNFQGFWQGYGGLKEMAGGIANTFAGYNPLGIRQMAGGIANMFGGYAVGNKLTSAGKHLAEANAMPLPLNSEGEEVVVDDEVSTWVARNISGNIPIMAALVGTAELGSAAIAGTVAKLGLSAPATQFMTGAAGGFASAPLESLMEAGSTYNDLIAAGKSTAEARQGAENTFNENSILLGFTAPLEFGMLKLPTNSLLKKGFKLGFEANINGMQEVVQEWINKKQQNPAIGMMEYAMSPEGQSTYLSGAAMGIGQTVVMGKIQDWQANNAASKLFDYNNQYKPSGMVGQEKTEYTLPSNYTIARTAWDAFKMHDSQNRAKQLKSVVDKHENAGTYTEEEAAAVKQIIDDVDAVRNLVPKFGNQEQQTAIFNELLQIHSNNAKAKQAGAQTIADKIQSMNEDRNQRIQRIIEGTEPLYFVNGNEATKDQLMTAVDQLEEAGKLHHNDVKISVSNDDAVYDEISKRIEAAKPVSQQAQTPAPEVEAEVVPAAPEETQTPVAESTVETPPVEANVVDETAKPELEAIWQDIYHNKNKGADVADRGLTTDFSPALEVGGDQYPTHGMAKSSFGTSLNELFSLFKNGVDKGRRGGLDTAPLVLPAGDAAREGGATAGGTSYADGSFILVGEKGATKITDINQVKGLLVNQEIVDQHPEVIGLLQKSFPGLVVNSYDNAKGVIEELNKQQPNEAVGTGENTGGIDLSASESVVQPASGTAVQEGEAQTETIAPEQNQTQTLNTENESPAPVEEGGTVSPLSIDTKANETTPEKNETEPSAAKNVNEPVGGSKESVGPAIKEKWAKAKKIVSPNTYTRILPNGTKVTGRDVLFPDGAATPSHNPESFASSEGFPLLPNGKNANSTDYTRPENQAEVVRIAGSYDGRAIQESPTITPDGVVIDGNNRTMSGSLAAKNGTDTEYNEALQQQIPRFGFTQEQYDEVAKEGVPRLGFLTDDVPSYDSSTFLAFNKNTKKTSAPIAEAIQLGRTVPRQTISFIAGQMEGHDNLSSFYNKTPELRATFDALQKANVLTPQQEPAYYNRSKNQITPGGKDFLESLMIGNVVGEDQLNMLTQDGVANFRQKIVLNLKRLTEIEGLKPEYSIKEALNDAISLKNELVSRKMDLDDYIVQADMFDDNAPSEEGVIVFHHLDGTQTEFTKFVTKYAERAKEGSSGQADMFTGKLDTKQEILYDIANKLNSEKQFTIKQAAARASLSNAGANDGQNNEVSQPDAGTPGQTEEGEGDAEPAGSSEGAVAEPAVVEPAAEPTAAEKAEETEVKVPSAAKSLAAKLREFAKTIEVKGDRAMAAGPFTIIRNGILSPALKLAANIIETTGVVFDAIKAAVDYVKTRMPDTSEEDIQKEIIQAFVSAGLVAPSRAATMRQQIINATSSIVTDKVIEMQMKALKRQIKEKYRNLAKGILIGTKGGKAMGFAKGMVSGFKTGMQQGSDIAIAAQKVFEGHVEEVRANITNLIIDAEKRGVFNGQVAGRVLSSVAKQLARAKSPVQLMRAMENISNVIQDSEYDRKMDVATKLKSDIKATLKNKTLERAASNVGAVKEFLKVNPREAESLEEYIALAQRILTTQKAMAVKIKDGVGIVMNETHEIDNSEMKDYTLRQLENAEKLAKERMSEMYDDLSEMGVIDPATMSLKEMKEMIDLINGGGEDLAESLDRMKAESAEKRRLMENVVEYQQEGLAQHFEDNQDSYTANERQIIIDIVSLTPKDLSIQQLVRLNDAINNIVTNNEFFNTGELAAISQAQTDMKTLAQKIKDSGIKLGSIANTVINSFASVHQMFEFITKSTKVAAEVQRLSGISALFAGNARASIQQTKVIKEYDELRAAAGKDIDSAENKFTRGVYARVIQNLGGTVEENQAEFERVKGLVQQSYERLSASSVESEKREGELVKKIYDNILKDAKTIFDVDAKVSDANKGLVTFWINKYAENFAESQDSAEVFNNKILDRFNNYTSARVKGVDKGSEPEDIDKALDDTFIAKKMDQNPSATKLKRFQGGILPKKSVYDFDFDYVQSKRFYETIYDNETAKAMAKVTAFFQSPQSAELLGGQENKNILLESVRKVRQVQKNKVLPLPTHEAVFSAVANTLQAKGARIALGSLSQLPKQYLSVASSTLINLGADMGLYFKALGIKALRVKDDIKLFEKSSIGTRGDTKAGYNKANDIEEIARTDFRNQAAQTIRKVSDFASKVSEFQLKALVASDVSVARTSWLAYYMQDLKRQGKDLDAIDWEKAHEDFNEEAGAYAEQMVSRSQNPNNATEMSSVYRDVKGYGGILKNIVMPFSSFSTNQRVRMTNDIQKIMYGGEKKEAWASLAATSTEMLAFNALKIYLLGSFTTALARGIASSFGLWNDDDEKASHKYEEIDVKRGPIEYHTTDKAKKLRAAIVNDFLFSGMGTMTQTMASKAMNMVYSVTATEEYPNGGKKNDKPDYVFMYDPSKNGEPDLQWMGTYSIPAVNAYNLAGQIPKVVTGKTEKIIKGGTEDKIVKKEVDLTAKEQGALAVSFMLDLAALAAIGDAEISTMNKKLKNIIDKKLDKRYGGEKNMSIFSKGKTDREQKLDEIKKAREERKKRNKKS